MNDRSTILLTILIKQEYQLSVREIWNLLSSDEQKLFGKQDEVSKYLSTLRKKELIKNGLTVYENGKTLLTWVITDAGKSAIHRNPAMNKEQKQEESQEVNVVEQSLDTADFLIKLTASANDILDAVELMAQKNKHNIEMPPPEKLSVMISVLDNYRSFITPINADHASVTSDAIALLERLKAA